MIRFLLQLVTWWNGATIGTRLQIWRHGDFVGEDELGNRYYRAKDLPPHGERRWVIYAETAEASAVAARWHSWLHHTTDTPPSDSDSPPKEWQQPHQENYTGTSRAYRPRGSTLTPEKRPVATGDYDAWSPE